jgi:DNA polymerase III subunit delta'
LKYRYFIWQDSVWQQLTARRAALPHALLFHGRHGIGKLAFVRAFAQWLLCEAPEPAHACGNCASCLWFNQGTHPDFRMVEPEAAAERPEAEEAGERLPADRKPKRHIGVDQIRALADLVNVSAHRSGFKLVLLAPAEAMNVHAANALLKTLEEPPPDTLFLLVSHRPRRMPPTILSRCQQMPMPVPSRADARRWLNDQGVANPELPLAEAGYAPLSALAVAEPGHRTLREFALRALSDPSRLDAIALADRLHAAELPVVVGWLQRWCYDLVRLRSGGGPRFNPDFAAALELLARTADELGLLSLVRLYGESQRIAQHPLNARLFLESLLLYYRRSILAREEVDGG